jgi:hypothetical protein
MKLYITPGSPYARIARIEIATNHRRLLQPRPVVASQIRIR